MRTRRLNSVVLGMAVTAASAAVIGCGSGNSGSGSPSSGGTGMGTGDPSGSSGGQATNSSVTGGHGTTGATSGSGSTASMADGATGSGGESSVCHVVGDDVQLTNAVGASRGPSIVWNGSEFVVAFSDERTGSGDIYIAQVAPDGTKKGMEAALVSTPTPSTSPNLAVSGNGLMVTWTEQAASGLAVMAEPLTPVGASAGAAALIATSTATEARSVVAPAFGSFAETWMSEMGGVETASVALLGVNGQPGTPAEVGSPAATASWPFPAASNDTLGVVYSDGRAGHLDVRMAIFDDHLAPKQDVVVRDAAGDANNPTAIWDGTRFIAAWEDLRSDEEQIYVTRVSRDGSVETPFLIHQSGEGSANWPRLASNGTDTVVTYYQFRDKGPQIYLSVLGADGSRKGGDLQVSHAPAGKARFAQVAYGNGQYGVVWEDTRFGDPEIFFARVACR